MQTQIKSKILWLVCLLATARLLCAADLRMEISSNPDPKYPIKVRVINGDPNAQYWIERSDDSGKTWEEYIRVNTGDWWYVSVRPQVSMFRAKLMTP